MAKTVVPFRRNACRILFIILNLTLLGQGMLALDGLDTPGGPLCGGGGPCISTAPDEPGAVLLREIYETKILGKLFDGIGAGEGSLTGTCQSFSHTSSCLTPPVLCGCERATIASRLLQRLEGGVFQTSELPGAPDGILLAGTSSEDKSSGGLSAVRTGGPLEGPRVPFSVRALIEVLEERLGFVEMTEGLPIKKREEAVLCAACGVDVSQPLQELLDSCVSFATLCRLNSFSLSMEAAERLSAFAAAPRRRERKAKGCRALSPGVLSLEASEATAEEHVAKATRQTVNGAFSSCGLNSPVGAGRVPQSSLRRDVRSDDRLKLSNCKPPAFLWTFCCSQEATRRSSIHRMIFFVL